MAEVVAIGKQTDYKSAVIQVPDCKSGTAELNILFSRLNAVPVINFIHVILYFGLFLPQAIRSRQFM